MGVHFCAAGCSRSKEVDGGRLRMIISQARGVRVGNLAEHAWSHLRRFHNVAFVQDEIVRLHKVDARHRKDAQKQATQIRYCLTQAREYYDAAAIVSLATKPTLLYYSIMSLALAEILLKQGGMSSLDKARQQHRHHGLLFQYRPKGGPADKSLANAALEPSARISLELVAREWGHSSCGIKSSQRCPSAGWLLICCLGVRQKATKCLLGPSDTQLPELPKAGLSLFDCLTSLPGMFEYISLQQIESRVLRGKVTAQTDLSGQTTTIQITLHPSMLGTSSLKT